MRRSFRVGILIYDGMDLLDYSGPAEVLSLTATSKLQQLIMVYRKTLPKSKPFLVSAVSESGSPIRTHAGTVIQSDFAIHNAPFFDILIIPGGPLRAVNKVMKNRSIIEYIVKSREIEAVCSVCTGALIVAEAGLLNGKAATTHHLAFSLLRNRSRNIQVVTDKKVVKDGNIITSGGISSGINMALCLVETLIDKDTALRTAKVLEFDGYSEGGV